MNLAQVDLNLLVILKHLLEEKHVSNTALALDMSQPTVSRSLQKLRTVFNDDLLVRAAYGYELTPKAEVIKQDLNSVLTRLEKLVHGDVFEPQTSDSTVRFFWFGSSSFTPFAKSSGTNSSASAEYGCRYRLDS